MCMYTEISVDSPLILIFCTVISLLNFDDKLICRNRSHFSLPSALAQGSELGIYSCNVHIYVCIWQLRLGILMNVPGFRHVGFLHAGFWLALKFYLPRGWWEFFGSMDECVMPSGLAELEQLHVKPNSEHLTSLHHISTHCR